MQVQVRLSWDVAAARRPPLFMASFRINDISILGINSSSFGPIDVFSSPRASYRNGEANLDDESEDLGLGLKCEYCQAVVSDSSRNSAVVASSVFHEPICGCGISYCEVIGSHDGAHSQFCYDHVEVRETCRGRTSRLGRIFEPPLVEQRLVGRDATRRGGVRRSLGDVGVGTPHAVGSMHETSNSTCGWLKF